jgi:hypothetical protein
MWWPALGTELDAWLLSLGLNCSPGPPEDLQEHRGSQNPPGHYQEYRGCQDLFGEAGAHGSGVVGSPGIPGSLGIPGPPAAATRHLARAALDSSTLPKGPTTFHVSYESVPRPPLIAPRHFVNDFPESSTSPKGAIFRLFARTSNLDARCRMEMLSSLEEFI